MRFVLISDTHGMHRRLRLPDGDVLVHAGDLTSIGQLGELTDFDDWLASLPHPHKIVVAGNHDWCFQHQTRRSKAKLRHATYLQDSSAKVGNLKVYGSPWQPRFCDWAFNLPRPELAAKWARIPDDTDVLVTHGPPLGHHDETHGNPVGCEALAKAVRRVRPKLHVFGHIHEGYGTSRSGGTLFANASTCDERYRTTNPPLVVDL